MADYRFFIMGGNDQSKLFLGNISLGLVSLRFIQPKIDIPKK